MEDKELKFKIECLKCGSHNVFVDADTDREVYMCCLECKNEGYSENLYNEESD